MTDYYLSHPSTYTLFQVEGFPLKREGIDADDAFILNWEDADILIPWPVGMSPKQAILAWAASFVFHPFDANNWMDRPSLVVNKRPSFVEPQHLKPVPPWKGES